jgi:tetratricopeptide (TPR) repeat protein
MAGIFARSAAALLLVGALQPWTPAMAKKEVDPDPILMSDSFRASIGAAKAALAAGQWSSASGLIAGLSPVTAFEVYSTQALRFELATIQRDTRAQRVALNALLKTTGLPQAEKPRLYFIAGWLAFTAGDYDDALAQLAQAKALGYDGLDATMLTADTLARKGKLKDARGYVNEVLAHERALSRPIPAAWYDRAIAFAYQAKDWDAVGSLYRERIALYPSVADWRSALAVMLEAPAGLDSQAQLDLYRLQAANGAMASERDYQYYAALAAKAGNDAEAKSVIEAGRAAGKLTPTQPATAQLLKAVAPKATKQIAGLPAAAKKAGAASGGSASLSVADSYFSLGQYSEAATWYRKALEKGGVDKDRARSRLGIALGRSGNFAAAQAELAQVGGDWRDVAGFWNVWLDQRARAQGAG